MCYNVACFCAAWRTLEVIESSAGRIEHNDARSCTEVRLVLALGVRHHVGTDFALVRGPVHFEVCAIRERLAVVAEIAQRDARLEHHQDSRALQLRVGHHIFKRKQGDGQNSCVRPRFQGLGV